MNILAIETSCDETSVAVVSEGRRILANAIASQIPLHQRYGGSRAELGVAPTHRDHHPCAGRSYDEGGRGLGEHRRSRRHQGPGLSPALLVGVNAAKAIAFARQKPLVAVNYIEGHSRLQLAHP